MAARYALALQGRDDSYDSEMFASCRRIRLDQGPGDSVTYSRSVSSLPDTKNDPWMSE